MRWQVLREFKRIISVSEIDTSSVYVVGGFKADPEVSHLINELRINPVNVEFFGIECGGENQNYLDLNRSPEENSSKGSLVLCSQVLEHVRHHHNFFGNLRNLTKLGGHVWINVPASNKVHGSPNYYSAGFHVEYLEENLAIHGFEVISSGMLGSHRYYVSTHLLQTWLTEQEHKNPLIFYNFEPGTFLGITKKFLFDWIKRIPLMFFSRAIVKNGPYVTESYILAKKNS